MSMKRGDVIEYDGQQTIVLRYDGFIFESYAIVLCGTNKICLRRCLWKDKRKWKWFDHCWECVNNADYCHEKILRKARAQLKRIMWAPLVWCMYAPVLLVLSPLLALVVTVEDWVEDSNFFGKEWKRFK